MTVLFLSGRQSLNLTQNKSSIYATTYRPAAFSSPRRAVTARRLIERSAN